MVIDDWKNYTYGWDPRLVISAVFVAVSANIIVFYIFPQFNTLLKYGKTAQQKQVGLDTPFEKAIEWFLSLRVPKSWFAHYYVFYLVLQWSQVYYIWLQNLPVTKNTVIWALLTLQATRRAVESYTLTEWSSKLKMHFTHYLVGLLYYLGISSNCFLGLLDNREHIQWSWQYPVLVVIFLAFSIDQFLNHKHLASLVKYSVPTFNFFKLVSCAHYFDEIFLYLTILLLLLVQQPYTVPDWNFLGSWIFVITNLSVSALGTKAYYKEKFDNYDVKYAIVPYIL